MLGWVAGDVGQWARVGQRQRLLPTVDEAAQQMNCEMNREIINVQNTRGNMQTLECNVRMEQ